MSVRNQSTLPLIKPQPRSPPQSFCRAYTRPMLKTTENIHVSDGLRRIVTFFIIAPYKYLTYLLTYLLTMLSCGVCPSASNVLVT